MALNLLYKQIPTGSEDKVPLPSMRLGPQVHNLDICGGGERLSPVIIVHASFLANKPHPSIAQPSVPPLNPRASGCVLLVFSFPKRQVRWSGVLTLP